MPTDMNNLGSSPSKGESADKPEVSDSSSMMNAIPPQGLLLLSIISLQVGAGLAVHLFPVLGAEGTVAVRIIFSAFLLAIVARTRIQTFVQIFTSNWRILLVFGLCIAAMNLFFYLAIARIPLGAAVAIEFIGPLGVAAFTSRRMIHFAWVALAALGIVLLSPLSGQDLDFPGMIFALLAGGGWALFIVLAGRVGNRVSGNDGLAIGMAIAAITMIPFATPVLGDLVSNPLILLAAFAVAILSTTIPFTLEFVALKRISARHYGVLVSVEPAVAAMVGVLMLGERIGIQGGVAVTCVVIAAIGITVSDGQTSS